MFERFEGAFGALAQIGARDGRGWTRLAWTDEDRAARAWFTDEARAIGLEVEVDRNGSIWAWWGRGDGAVATGSHLDTVPDGGAYDGALGVVAGLLAVEQLRGRGVEPRRPIAVVAFADEEGARFDTPTFASSLSVGARDPGDVLDRTDADGVRVRDALAAAGVDPDGIGPDPERIGSLEAFIELHVEQGRSLDGLDAAVGVATGIWPHGRWRIELVGEANHAGTTRLVERHDPVLVLAVLVDAAREAAADRDAVATVGRLAVEPNTSNAIPRRVIASLDVRAPDARRLAGVVEATTDATVDAADAHGVEVIVERVSHSPVVVFDRDLRRRLRDLADAPELPTAAGHDAGQLARSTRSAMLFIRNPTGASHTPAEHADTADCLVGIRVLADILEELACR